MATESVETWRSREDLRESYPKELKLQLVQIVRSNAEGMHAFDLYVRIALMA